MGLGIRHRVRNNMPGSPKFCPLVFKSKALGEFIGQDLKERARAVVSGVPKDLLARTAAFLLLKDSKSSYVIEGERPPQDRIQRWGRAIGEAGRTPLDEDELLRLQRIVIGDGRFVKLGLRTEVASLANMSAIRDGRSRTTSAGGLTISLRSSRG
jgi:hypothetical protein